MKNKLINYLIAFIGFWAIQMESCKCNNHPPTPCPECKVIGQYCENMTCKCPEGEEVIGGKYCIKINRKDSTRFYWKPILTNGNCLDSVICEWLVDLAHVDSGTAQVSGNTSLGFRYNGTNPSNYFDEANGANVKKTSKGYEINCIYITMACLGPPGGLRLNGFTNLAQDTLWCHFIKSSFGDQFSNYGEFDQIFVRY